MNLTTTMKKHFNNHAYGFKEHDKGITEIFRNDIKTIISNPVVMIALIIIICLPSLYSLVNISAVWNPYNETSNMKVAVVDNDLGYTSGGVDYNFGKIIYLMN